MSQITTTVGITEVLAPDDTPLTIAATGNVLPSAYGAAGVTGYTAGLTLNNLGNIIGGDGGSTSENISNGGIGVDLTAADSVSNSGAITGGSGNTYHAPPGSNVGNQQPADNSYGGGGGEGIEMSGGGSLTNSGVISGGSGAAGTESAGKGGAGIDISFSKVSASNEFTNGGRIEGGSGGVGGQVGGGGGDAVDLLANPNLGLRALNDGQLQGGSGEYGSLLGGNGGTGLTFGGTGSQFTNDNGGTIKGGIGGNSISYGGSGGDGVFLNGGLLIDTGAIAGGNGGVGATLGTGGVGAYLLSGTLATSGKISGGVGGNGSVPADSVQFGGAATLMVQSGAQFVGAIGGFSVGDTVEITNLAPLVVESEFSNNVLTTANDGVLQFSGDFTGERFAFYADGNGTDIKLTSAVDTITGPVTQTVVLGGITYPSPLTISSTGSVTPTSLGTNGVVNANGAAPSLTNAGTIDGASGAPTAGTSNSAGFGGIGVDLTLGGTVTNSGNISGGNGGVSDPRQFQYGGGGGVGVYLSRGYFTNSGRIVGGAGGAGINSVTSGGRGGLGAALTSTDAINTGVIQGGIGGYGSFNAASGGTGISLDNGILTNQGSVAGGAGGGDTLGGGSGGTGAVVAIRANLYNDAGASISGGTGGFGYQSAGGSGGVGVVLDGGTLTTSGTIAGGRQGSSGGPSGSAGPGGTTNYANAVQFGAYGPSTLVVDSGAVFRGSIGGFAIGDTIDITNLTPSQVSADFAGNVLTTSGDGTLSFTGNFTGEGFNFYDDGSGGTDIRLSQGVHTIAVAVDTTVTIGSANYPGPLTITSTGSISSNLDGTAAVTNANEVSPTLHNHGRIAGADGNSVLQGGAGIAFTYGGYIANDGNVFGGSAGYNGGGEGSGGAGIFMDGARLYNFGSVLGGSGNGHQPNDRSGGQGGSGVYARLSSSVVTNSGAINGGIGGNGTVISGSGGAGVTFFGQGGLYNLASGSVVGGNGGGYGSSTSGMGGSGIYSKYGVINNEGTVRGGNGGDSEFSGAAGGSGITEIRESIVNSGNIIGGAGGSSSGNGSFASGGAGGVGVSLSSGGTFRNFSSGSVSGGQGGYDAAGGAGVSLNRSFLYNYGALVGGQGGPGNQMGGAGGDGVIENNGATARNLGSIKGGMGGTSGPDGFSSEVGGANGGIGVYLSAGSTFVNDLGATISGGAGADGYPTGTTNGGVGIFLNGGTITTAGSISGGVSGVPLDNPQAAGLIADAIEFGAPGGTLKVESGASFDGAIGGFATGDTVDIINLSVGAALTDFVNNTLTTPSDGTLEFSGTFSGESFAFSADGNGGTDITLATTTAPVETMVTTPVTVGSDSFFSVSQDGSIAPTEDMATGLTVTSPTASVTNAGSIQGGSGGSGVQLTSGTVTVTSTGSVSGGAAASGTGGAGVVLNGGTLITAGNIAGGIAGDGGTQGDAVQFGSQASTLVIEPGATFVGQVAANLSTNDVLELGGSIDPTLVNLGTQFTGFSTLLFDPNAAWTVDATEQGITGLSHIQGFDASDTIDITDVSYARGASASLSNGVLTIEDGTNSPILLNIDGDYSGYQFVVSGGPNNSTDITLQAETACYLRGTRIRTATGYVPIENLAIGDRLVTAAGAEKSIRWLGWRRIKCDRHPNSSRVWPICIQAGAFSENVPIRDLYVSPGHSIFTNGVLIEACELVNDATILRVQREQVEYWHVELDDHDIIFAEGLSAESYLDTGNRSAFINGGAFIEAHPDFKASHWEDTCAKLAKEGPVLLRAKAELLTRAADLGHVLTCNSDAHIIAGTQRFDPVLRTETQICFELPAGLTDIEMRSRAYIPGHLTPSQDYRTLGLCVGRLQLDGVEIQVDDEPNFASGWHALESYENGDQHRWTKDRVRFPDGTRHIVMGITGPSYCWAQSHEMRKDGAKLSA